MKSHWFTALLPLSVIIQNGPVSANGGGIAFTGATIIGGTEAAPLADGVPVTTRAICHLRPKWLL